MTEPMTLKPMARKPMTLIRAPRNPRDFFETFRFYINSQGFGSLLDRIDFTQVSPSQINYACFAGLPSEADARYLEDGYDAVSYLQKCISSARFRKDLVTRLLAAFPEKRRLLFVHVPKCAGSDLTQHLLAHYPSIDQRIVDAEWFDLSKVFVSIKRLAEHAPFTDDIFVHGHIPLRQYIAAGQIRFGDKIFAVLRQPAEIVVSKVNYIITRLQNDEALSAVDTRGWLRFIDRGLVDRARVSGDVMPLAKHILHSRDLTGSNTICQYLGYENAESCFALCAQAGAEITDIEHYPEWLRVRWGIQSETRRNASVQHVKLADLDTEDMQRIENVTGEDRKVFDSLKCGLDARRCLSLIGAQLGRGEK